MGSGRKDGFANILEFIIFLNRGNNCADVTKIRKTRVVRDRMNKIRARAITHAYA